MAVVVAHDLHMVATGVENRFKKFEMNGRHLRAENGIFLAHLLGEDHTLQLRGADLPLFLLLFLFPDGGEERTDADSCRSQVAHFVDLQAGINLIGTGKNVVYLIGGHSIQTAAKGVELNQIQIVSGAHISRSRIESGMVHPLIRYDERTIHLPQMGHGILCEHRQSVGGNQLRDAVVDLGIQMVGTAGKNDALPVIFLNPFNDLFALFPGILAGGFHFLPARRGSTAHFLCGKFLKFPDQSVCGGFQAGKCHERIAQHRLAPSDFLHVILDVFRIGSDDGAVVVIVCPFRLVSLIEQRGIEDEVHSLLDQPCHMPVGQLGRITLRFTGDGLDAELINGMGGTGGENHLISELCEKGIPERIVLIHVQHSGNAYPAPPGLICGQRLIGKQPFQLVFKQIGHLTWILRLSKSPLAAVAGDILTAAGEPVNGQTAVVGAALALCHAGFKFQGIDLVNGEHGGLIAGGIVVPRDQRRAERSHDAGDIRTDRFAVCDFFKAAEHRIVIKGSALHHDLASQLGGIGYLDDLKQRVFDDGIGKAR